MKIYQLFKERVPEGLATNVVKCFGLESMDDISLFSRNDVIKHDTIQKLLALKEELEIYYLPCKAKCYLVCIDYKKAITILRQVLRLFGLTLHTRQKYVQSKKITFYNIAKENKNACAVSMKSLNVSTTVNFD